MNDVFTNIQDGLGILIDVFPFYYCDRVLRGREELCEHSVTHCIPHVFQAVDLDAGVKDDTSVFAVP